MKCRILVVDDHELVRRGINALFETQADMCVCAEAGDGRDAIAKALQLRPHVVIIDAGMPRLNGISAARRIMAEDPKQRIILFSDITSEPMLRLALSTGIKGIVFKTDPLSDLIDAVNAVRHDQVFFSGDAGKMILKGYLESQKSETVITGSSGHCCLTLRELEIAQLLAEGKCSKEVACLLGLSVKTAETHRSNLMRKLHIHNLPNLVLFTIKENIIEVPIFDRVIHSKAYTAAAS